jgi:hypothetical protein
MDRRVGVAAVAGLVGSLVCAPPASAGGYDVKTCATVGGRFPNHAWALDGSGAFNVGNICTASARDPQVSVVASAGASFSGGQHRAWTFTAPSGTTIRDFRLRHQLYQYNPTNAASDARLYTLVQLGSTVLEATGHYSPPPPTWYASGEAYDTGDLTSTSKSFPASANYAGNATSMRVAVGCQVGPCSLRSVGAAFAKIVGVTVTVNDPTRPVIARIAPTGLAAGGVVGGDEPLTFDATDNSGIRRAELLDVTERDNKSVGVKDFGCDYSYASPCPQPTGGQVMPSGLAAGLRTLVLRLTDAGGNTTDSDRFVVDVGGPLNGTPASAAARLTAKFARKHRASVTVGFRKRARIRGRLVDAAGTPIAGAVIQVLDRQLRSGTQYALRGEITTGPKGRFSLMPGKGPARAIRFEYRSRRLLAAPNAADRVTMRVRAGVTLRIRPKRVAPGGRIRITGRLKGRPLPHSGKVVDLQAFEAGRWRTFDTVRARKKGRFTTRYRFVRASGGLTIAFRARVRREDSYPFYLGYSKRVRVRLG